MTVSLTHAIAVAVEKFAECGPGKWWFVHHPDGFLIECALQQRAEQIAAEINAGRSNSPDKFCVQASAAEDRRTASAAPITPSAATVPPRAPKAGEVFPSGLASTNLAGRDSGNPDSAILTAPAELSPAIAARQAGPTQPKIQKDEEDRAANPKRRPHCMNPSACGSYTARHCYSCRKALDESEAA